MKKKITYKVRNWREYNQSLINRGNITLWVNEDAIQSWFASTRKTPGRPFLYSDQCILLALSLRSLFGLTLRATQGFLTGLMSLMSLPLPVPNYTRLCRRAKSLKIDCRIPNRHKRIDIAIDSTGLKIYGEGEWKMRTHGKSKRRTWRKFHVAIDPKSKEAIAVKLTKANVGDGPMMEQLLKGLKNIGNVYADGIYISKGCFNRIVESGARAKIPLRTGTSLAKARGDPGLEERNRLLREIWLHGGRHQWMKKTDYHRRSLVENYMYRFKTIFGGKLASRNFENQRIEAMLKSSILNRITQLGMPQSYPVCQ